MSKAATFSVNTEEAKMLVTLLTQATSPGPSARTLANLYDKAVQAQKDTAPDDTKGT